LQRAQRLVRKHVKPTTSLVDELIAERHEAAGNEDRGGRFRSARSTESGSWSGKTDARTLERSCQQHCQPGRSARQACCSGP
jgi:hypothetical protein